VDLDERTLFIAETKFFKVRWVPFSVSLSEQLHAYRAVRDIAVIADHPDDAFFISSRNRPYSYSHVARTFQRLVQEAGIDTSATRRGRARLHDLRHTFAVHCVLRWYREGADVQAKLPLLATYLGHGTVLATHVYLHASTAVLQEASERFERAYGSLGIAPPEEIFDVLG
jgi:integrase